MEADEMKPPLMRPVGERFAHPRHGELIVVEKRGCDGCAFDINTCTVDDRRAVAGTCSLRGDHSVVFAKPDNYAIYKLTGEWP